MKQTRRQVEL